MLCGLAWIYLVDQAAGMSEMLGVSEAGGLAGPWTLRDLGYLFVMWSVMMVAMMIPSATPTILLFARMHRTRRQRAAAGGKPSPGRPGAPVAAFVLGYLLIWTAYSLAVATGQWALHRALLVSPAMVSVSPLLSGVLLVAAGAFQFSRLKYVCIRHCRSPLAFLSTHWREGTLGSVVMGMHHGGFCVGCCWALMALLFVLGVMNLPWVVALAALVLVEQTFPAGRWITRGAGVALIVWGGWVLLTATI